MRDPVAVHRLAGKGGIGQGLLDDVVGGEHADVRVGELGQFYPALGQVMRRAPLGDHQRQYLAQGQAPCGEAFGVTGG
ncbi:hypothetical protein D3C71_1791140 [compost metagenome]